MDCTFKKRKRELESECKLPKQAFATASKRLITFMQPFLSCYHRRDQKAHATTVIQGLCSDQENKNGESIAYLFRLDRKSIQHFIGISPWDDAPLRKELSQQIGTVLGEPDGVLAFDPSAQTKTARTGFARNLDKFYRHFGYLNTRACF